LNSEKIWELWKKSKLNSEKLWKIQKKSKLKSEEIGKKEREKEMFYIRHVLGQQLSDISRVVFQKLRLKKYGKMRFYITSCTRNQVTLHFKRAV
jgi:hypothetical protein